MPIRILPTEVASQIAAGEVVERPASVVKELIENALDAKASVITISVQGAGRALIEVADDGVGIQAEELPLAVERHATSKLTNAEDLFQIATLGFRGEALASIGSVARLTITSRTQSAEAASRLLVEGGQVFSVQPVGAPTGTLVRVENLFFNVPARLKFLKTDATERRLIDQLVTRYTLAYPSVRFQHQQDGRVVLASSGRGNRREALGALFDPDTASRMLAVDFRDNKLEITGFISPTSITRTNRKEILFFINGRPVQDPALSAALMKGYYSLLMVGRYPLAVLFLNIPAESVDVNVHPTKAEVRFREPDRIFLGVQSAVRRALLANNPIPGLQERLHWEQSLSGSERLNSSLLSGSGWSTAVPNWNEPGQPWLDNPPGGSAPLTSDSSPLSDGIGLPDKENPLTPAQSRLPNQRISILRPVGQIASAYLIAEGPDGLYLIDQHAAHERVLYERLLAQQGSAAQVQELLQPAPVEIPAAKIQLMEELLPILAGIGYQLEPFGSNTYLVRAIPALLIGSDPASGLRSLVENFEEDESAFQNQVEARLIARICKRAAVKAGMTISLEEQRKLILELENCQAPRTCPHGRPTMIHLSVDLLERQFGRRGAR